MCVNFIFINYIKLNIFINYFFSIKWNTSVKISVFDALKCFLHRQLNKFWNKANVPSFFKCRCTENTFIIFPSFFQLSQLRGNDRKFTLLHALVEQIMLREPRLATFFLELAEFETVPGGTLIKILLEGKM